MKPKYSGPVSARFWNRIVAIKSNKLHAAVYVAACALQDHEGRVLQILKDAEKK